MTCFTGRSKNIRSGGDLALPDSWLYNGLTGTGQKAVARNKNLSTSHTGNLADSDQPQPFKNRGLELLTSVFLYIYILSQ
jgi:hypothetical protein